MINHFKRRFYVFILALLIAFTGTFTAFAALIDITLIPQLNGDCVATIQPTFNLSGSGQFADITAPDRDRFSIVLFDGDGLPVGYLYNWVAVGFNGSVTNWSFGNLTIDTPPVTRPFTIRVYDVTVATPDIVSAMSGPLLDELTFDPAAIGACTTLPLAGSSGAVASTSSQPLFNDGRLNDRDAASPVVVYGHDFETGRGLVIYAPVGGLLLQVSPEQISEIADCPDENTLLASTPNIALYRLSSCEFQLNAPSLDGAKTYVLIFKELYPNTGYSSYEE